MASVSESEGNEVGPTTTLEVGPTEGVIQALMETLVDPLLPLSVSGVPLQEEEQKSVAKQMHAVALLYNYHYRKQKPDLKFLDLVSFSKLVVDLRPPLASFMKLTTESQPPKSNISNDHLSVTEKAIKDACDIALSLDSSEDFPNIGGWPVSKVAVLLIDPKKENCILRFGDITKGVWSLIEKEFNNESNTINAENVLSEETIGDKRKRNSLLTCDNELLQLGYDALKDVTGIESSELTVLGTHVTYSQSKEKSAVQFYVMQCSRSFSVQEEVSLKFLVESLQGPLSEKLDHGIWKTTTIVEFYHMLPYVEFISCWLSGKDFCPPTIKDRVSQSTTDSCNIEVTQTVEPDLAFPKENGYNNSLGNSSGMKVNSPGKTSTENCEKARSPVILENKKIKVKPEISDTVDSENMLTGVDNLSDKFDKKGDTANLGNVKEESGICSEILYKGMNGHSKELSTKIESDNTSKKVSSNLRVYQLKRRKKSLAPKEARVVEEDGGNLKVNMAVPLKSHHVECRHENVLSEVKEEVGVAAKEDQVIHLEDKTKYTSELRNVSASAVVQNALALLHEKRQKLYSKLCHMGDTLASCESDIARIRDGMEVGFARKYNEYILSWNNPSMLEHGIQNGDYGKPQCDQKETKSSEIYLPGKSACQDLDYICLKNNWRLPRYLVEPSDGKFVSSVFVWGEEFELHLKGGLESKPCEARESAAAQIIAKLRNS